MNILLAADGSDYTKRAARYLVEHFGELAQKPKIHVLHVRAPLPFPGAAAAAGAKAVEDYLHEESHKALAVAEKELRKGGVEFDSSWVVGEAVPCVKRYVKKHHIDLIAMGSHGHGALAGMVLGSFAARILAALKTPVLIVR